MSNIKDNLLATIFLAIIPLSYILALSLIFESLSTNNHTQTVVVIIYVFVTRLCYIPYVRYLDGYLQEKALNAKPQRDKEKAELKLSIASSKVKSEVLKILAMIELYEERNETNLKVETESFYYNRNEIKNILTLLGYEVKETNDHYNRIEVSWK